MQGRGRAGRAAVALMLALAAASAAATAASAVQQAPTAEEPAPELLLPLQPQQAAQTPAAATTLPAVMPARAPAAMPPLDAASLSQAAAAPLPQAPAVQAPAAPSPQAPAAQALAAQEPASQALASQSQTPAALTPAAQAAAQLASVLHSQLGDTASADAWDAGSLAADALGPAAVTLRGVQRGLCQSGSPPVPVVELTIAQAQATMLEGRLNCSQLVAAYLQRILAFDQPLQLNSIRAVNPACMERATQLDAELAAMRANGTSALPSLFCVPLLVKDNIDVAGLATTAGSVSLAYNMPPADAIAVALLQQRGALVLAKTAMGEFAFFPSFCLSSLSGTVRNPYNLGRTPAGSSGGSAAGTAASLGMAALGTDTGNSVRGPSSHTALVGFRPSLGLVSRSGVVPLRTDRDTIGPMARTVEDAVRVFEALVGPPDPADPLSQLLQNVSLPANFTQFLNPNALKGVRIGVFRQISELPGADPDIQALFEDALESLRLGGATLVDQFTITGNRLGLDWDANRGGDGPAIGHWNVAGRWEDLWADQAPFKVGIDAYLAAGNASTKHRSLQDIYRSGEFHPEVEDELLSALRTTNAPEDYPTPAMKALGMVCGGGWLWTDPCRTEFRRNLIDSMGRLGLAALVYPTWNQPPLRVGDRRGDPYDGNNSPLIAPHTGSPAVTVPMGFVGDGLPAGLQFLGRPMDDDTVLGLAYAYEQLTQHRKPPALFPECTDLETHDYAVSAAPQAG